MEVALEDTNSLCVAKGIASSKVRNLKGPVSRSRVSGTSLALRPAIHPLATCFTHTACPPPTQQPVPGSHSRRPAKRVGQPGRSPSPHLTSHHPFQSQLFPPDKGALDPQASCLKNSFHLKVRSFPLLAPALLHSIQRAFASK